MAEFAQAPIIALIPSNLDKAAIIALIRETKDWTGSYEQTSKHRRGRTGKLNSSSGKSNYDDFSVADVERLSLLQTVLEYISSFTA
jgi:hypothetical protein